MQELSYIFIDQISDRYGKMHVDNYRYFVQSKELFIDDKVLEKHEFQLSDNEISSIDHLIPSLSWINGDNEEVEVLEVDGRVYAEDIITGIRLDTVPYDTDIILIDEYGNTTVLKNNVPITKNEARVIKFGFIPVLVEN